MKSATNNPKDHRLGLRVLGYWVLIFFVYWIINLILGVIPNWSMTHLAFSDDMRIYLGSTLTYGLRLVAIIALSAWALRKVIGENPWKLMFPRKDWWKDLLFGFILTFMVVFLIFILEIKSGWLVVENWKWQIVPLDSFFRNLWLALLINLSVAVGEEMMFRGFLLSGLKRAWGTINAILIMVVIFAALHLIVSGADETFPLFFILLLTVPGFVLGWAFLRTRALWLPIAIHFTWNLLQDEIFNLASRDTSTLFGAVTQQNGPPWIVGTSYGMEVGAAGVLGMIIIGIAVWLWTRKKQAE